MSRRWFPASDAACAYCGFTHDRWERRLTFHLDHIIPKSWSLYETGPENLIAACEACNRDKGAHDPVSWFSRLVRFDGAVIGRGETLADDQATNIWNGWGDEIRAHAGFVRGLSASGAVPFWDFEAAS